MATGVTKRGDGQWQGWYYDPRAVTHKKACASRRNGAACDCEPTRGRKVYKTFDTATAARTWRSDATREVRRGTLKAPAATTLRQA